MWASRWKITIGRPRKTSLQSGYFFVFRDEVRGRPIVAGLSRTRIARTGHLFGEKLDGILLWPLLLRRGLSPIFGFIFLWGRRFRAHPSLHALITICPSPDLSATRRRLAFFFPFSQLENINCIFGYRTYVATKSSVNPKA